MCCPWIFFFFIFFSFFFFFFFLFSVWNPKYAGVSRGAGMNGMGCTDETGHTSKAGQFLRVHHSTRKRRYIQFFELLEAITA